MSQKRAPQIPLNEFLEAYTIVAKANGTAEDLAERLGGRDVGGIYSRISSSRKRFPQLDKFFDDMPLASSGGGGRKRTSESELVALLAKLTATDAADELADVEVDSEVE